jgi:MATE family multidrug resistance protein
VVSQGLILSVLLTLPLLCFGEELGLFYFRFLKLPPEEFPLAAEYLSIILKCCFFVFVKVTFASFFSGIGKTKTVMLVNLVGLMLNVPLGYFLIHGGLGESYAGVKGAALGTVCAEVVMTLIYTVIFWKKHADGMNWSYQSNLFKKLIKFGLPTGIEFFVLTFAFNTFLTMFHSYGIHAAEAIAVTSTWSWLTVLPFFGLNVGIMSLVGHAMGENNPDLAVRITRSALKIALGITAIASIAFLGFTSVLVESFGISKGSSAYELAFLMICTLPLYCLFDAMEFVFTGTLRASGDTRFCLMVSTLGHWTCLVICFYGTYYGGFYPLAIWAIFIFNLFAQSTIDGLRYLQGSWKSLKLVDHQYTG